MNTQQLQCFVCVADTLNFTKAAEILFLSTPTVSHHIKSLEEELQVTLFIRTSKLVKLTESGSSFYSDAKEILSKIDLSQKRAQKVEKQKVSILRIGCTSNTELLTIQDCLTQLHHTFPQVLPHISIHDFFRLKTLFNEHQLDVLLASKEMTKDIQQGVFKKIKDVSSYALMTTDHILAQTQQPINFSLLKDYQLITLHPRFIPFQYGNKLQEQIALHSQSHFNIRCENDQAAILLARSGYGIAILPDFCIPAPMKDMAILPIVEETTIEYGVLYRSGVKEDYIKYFVKNLAIKKVQ
ncbi:LysR family transcriptional regulator [Amedibacillus sp. YH-ame6]